MANVRGTCRIPAIGRCHGSVAAAIAIATTAVACGSGTDTPRTVALVAAARVPAPFSIDSYVLLLDDHRVCVNNSFEMRVRCVDRDGGLVGVFGRKGEGPGEFQLPPSLLRGQDGTVGALSMNRLSVFTPGGDLVDEKPLAIIFPLPARNTFDTTLLAHYYPGADMTPVEVDLSDGSVLWERDDIDTVAETECGDLSLGVASPSGGWTFPACQDELVFLEHRDAPTARSLQSPTYAEEFPNERDIAEFDGQRSFIDLDTYRQLPKRNHLTVGSLAYDDHGRLWVATQRDRAHFSYFDLYVGTEYVGSVRIRDRVLGYDLYGSTLAALVEREPGPDGIGWRAVDWYDIGALGLGLGTSSD